MNEVTSPTRFSSPAGGRTDAGDRGARGLDRLRRLLERECEAQVGLARAYPLDVAPKSPESPRKPYSETISKP